MIGMDVDTSRPSPSSSSSSLSASESHVVQQALTARGWRFRDLDLIRGLIEAQSAGFTADSIESELLNIDLRSIGAKSLPEPSALRKTYRLQGPIVLQVCSCRDISRSSMADAAGYTGSWRLLQLKLTDGHSEITSVERSHVPSIPDDISPGTKVRLVGKADIYSGILCLNKRVITILGGVVQSLYEEWQLKRKYMIVTRYASRFSQENESNCPPPFEKLQIGASALGTTSTVYTYENKGYRSSEATGASEASSNDSRQILAAKGEPSRTATMDSIVGDTKQLDNGGDSTEKPTCSSARPKVSASAPVQNQAAAQKLLQKASQPNTIDRNSRNQRHRGKFKEEDLPVLTLNEWEMQKTRVDPMKIHEHNDISRDEYLARQLEKQFELEDMHAQKGVDPESIKMSMFSFERDNAGTTEFRGRGRGRGRRRGGRY